MPSNLAKFLIVLLISGLVGCGNDSSFSGSSQQDKPKPEPREEPRDLDARGNDEDGDNGWRDDEPDVVDVRDDEEDDGFVEKDDVPYEPPQDAVTAGSFTAWTEPADPIPGQAYRIIIEVKLPSDVSNYQKRDLSGMVIGTDGYRQGLGRDSNILQTPNPGPFGNDPFITNNNDPFVNDPLFPGFGGETFDVFSDRARLSVSVPGAAALVEDTIEITSDVLDESQQLVITF